MACSTMAAPTQLYPAVQAFEKVKPCQHVLQHSNCSTRNYSEGCSGPIRAVQGRQQQARYAPYSTFALRGASAQRTEQTVLQLQACSSDQQRHAQMLELSINLANSSLEATLTAFHLACLAPPRSATALQALDAAKAALAQTTRLTSIASVLAKRCAHASAAFGGSCDVLLQSTHQLRDHLSMQLNQQLQQQAALLAAVGGPAAVPLFLQFPAAEEDVEEGEEVTSSAAYPQCSCSQCPKAL